MRRQQERQFDQRISSASFSTADPERALRSLRLAAVTGEWGDISAWRELIWATTDMNAPARQITDEFRRGLTPTQTGPLACTPRAGTRFAGALRMHASQGREHCGQRARRVRCRRASRCRSIAGGVLAKSYRSSGAEQTLVAKCIL
jgi:hypothetical protein